MEISSWALMFYILLIYFISIFQFEKSVHIIWKNVVVKFWFCLGTKKPPTCLWLREDHVLILNTRVWG